jgi:hypothetical protein
VPVVMADEFFPVRKWRYFLEVVQLILRPPPPQPSKGGGVLLAWGGCYVGETVESVWFFVYEFVKIVCLQEISELGGVDQFVGGVEC